MGKGAYILGGALQGIGAGLMQQGQANAEARAKAEERQFQAEQASATQRFQQMLADQRAKAEADRDAQNHQWDMERDKAQAGYRAEQAERDAGNTIDRDARLHDYKKEEIKLDARNKASLARLQSQLNMNEAQAKISAEMLADVQQMKKEVGHTEITKDGRLIIYSKNGEVLRASAPGTFNPKSSGDDSIDPMASRSAASPPARPVATPAAPPARNSRPAPTRSLDDIFGTQPQPPVASTLTNTFSR